MATPGGGAGLAASGMLAQVVGEEVELLADLEPGGEEAAGLGGGEGAGDHPLVAMGGELLQAALDERRGRNGRVGDRGEVGDLAVTTPRPGPGPLGPPRDDVDSGYAHGGKSSLPSARVPPPRTEHPRGSSPVLNGGSGRR